ncbi:hypothetical protein [Cohnella sp. 56]|uniref:hypothetical protein n=1 Tax=Cohnella sp. 56 TaxID=3113722 RepID=UPI0030E897A8
MQYVPFIVGSAIECFGVFIVMFSLFRFRLNTRAFITVSIVAFMMSQLSYFTRLNPETSNLSTYIQFAMYVIVLWVLFRVPVFYSILMNFAGFAVLVVVQGITILVLGAINNISLETIKNNGMINAATQLLTFILMLSLARLILRFNWGFDFVPTSRRHEMEFKGTNVTLIAVIISAIVVLTVVIYVFRNEYKDFVIYASLVFLLTLPAFLYFSLRKDNEDAA